MRSARLRPAPPARGDPRPARRALPAVLALLLAGAAGEAGERRTVTVFAAASLRDAFLALKPLFEEARPGVTLRFSFGSSAHLAAQIRHGAPPRTGA